MSLKVSHPHYDPLMDEMFITSVSGVSREPLVSPKHVPLAGRKGGKMGPVDVHLPTFLGYQGQLKRLQIYTLGEGCQNERFSLWAGDFVSSLERREVTKADVHCKKYNKRCYLFSFCWALDSSKNHAADVLSLSARLTFKKHPNTLITPGDACCRDIGSGFAGRSLPGAFAEEATSLPEHRLSQGPAGAGALRR